MNGFIIGKFCPPHLGHDHLIRAALAATDELTVIVCGKQSQAVPAQLRVQWLQETYPSADVRLLDQDAFDDTSEEAWTNATKKCLGRVPALMFSSEDYGNHYADLLGCKHVLVDRDRLAVPVSATQILARPVEMEEYLLPVARSWFRLPGRP